MAEPGRLAAALPWALSMAGAVSGVLIGFTLSEAADPGYARLPAPYWIGTLIGVITSVVCCILASPYVSVPKLQSLKAAVAASTVRILVAAAALGLAVGLASVLMCALWGAWRFSWPVFWLCAATAPVYGAIAGLGAVLTRAYHRPP